MASITPKPRRILAITLAVLQGLALAFGVAAPTAHAGPGSRTLIDFEDQPVGSPVYSQYTGVTFVGGDAGDHPIVIGAPAEGTASGTQALLASTTSVCHHEFFCRTMRILFDEPQSLIQLSTGLATTGGNITVLATGLTGAGTQVAQNQGSSLCAATGRTPVQTPLTLSTSTPSMVEADLAYVFCTGPDAGTPAYAVAGMPLEVDDLAFTLPLSPPPGEHDPPVFTSVSPTDGATATGRYPLEIYTDLDVTVHEHALRTLTASVNGGPEQELLFRRTDTDTYSGGLALTPSVGLKAGANSVRLTATDFDRPQNTATRVVTFTFTPLPSTATSDDIRLRAFEVTQALDPGPQGLATSKPLSTSPNDGFEIDYNPSIPLLEGKQTLIRVYATLFGSIGPVKNVPANMTVRRAHCASGCDLMVNSPPVVIDPATGALMDNLSGITVNALSEGDLARAAADLSTTWDFQIPAGYVSGDLDLTFKLNDGHYTFAPSSPSVPECTSTQDWECQHNNTLLLHVHFQPAPTIRVDTILIRAGGTYTCPSSPTYTYKGVNYNGKKLSPTDPGAPPEARMPTTAQVNEVFRVLNLVYPMHVNQGFLPPLDIDVATADKDNLIAAVRDRATSGGEMIIGLLPVDPRCPLNYGPNEHQSDGSVVVGFGGVGNNGAWADVNNPIESAHELGHNIGFDHWACENGVHADGKSDDECSVFPIAHGGIDAYGTDLMAWRVIPPGDNSSNSTPHAHDFMTYGQLCALYGAPKGCDTGEWVSWYTYGILYSNPNVGDYDTEDPPAFSITGTISQSGSVTFQPVYAVGVNHPLTDLIHEDDTDQLYTLQGYDAKGNVIFVHNFEPARQEVHGPHQSQSYYFREDVPQVAGLARIDLLKGTTVVGSLTSAAPGATPTVSIAAPSAGAQWPVGSQQTIRWTSASPAHLPLRALVQYSPDGGTTRYTLARDLTASELTVNADDLPGSATGTIYVVVSDGLNTASAQTGPIIVALKPPHVVITSPFAVTIYAAPIPVTFSATAYDPQRGTDGLKYTWSADNGKYAFSAAGTALTLQNALPVGAHTVTVSVTNSAGLTAKASVDVTVIAADASRPGAPQPSPQVPWWLVVGIALLAVILLIVLFRSRRPRKSASSGSGQAG